MDIIGPIQERYSERIDHRGQLQVPVFDWWERPPEREGWKPYFVNVNLNRVPVKVYTYREKQPM